MKWIAGAIVACLVANFLPWLYVLHPTLGAVGYSLGIVLIFFVAPTLLIAGLTRIFTSARR